MFIEVVKSKIHKATVTEANLQYVGSITIDVALMEAANIIENEKVQIVNVNNGEKIRKLMSLKAKETHGGRMSEPARRPEMCSRRCGSSLFPMHSMDFEEAKKHTPTLVFPDTNTNRLI